MGLEVGTFVEDLVVTNPPGGDSKSQGDDHLRLIKNVLRNTFKRATKAVSFPGSISKTANYTVLATDDNLTILCDTTASFTLTLPVLALGDAGWQIYVVKTTLDANPVFIAPPSGLINGFSKVRRSVEFVSTRVLWTGGIFVATRPFGDPIGASVDYHGSTLPNGYLWADGAAFSAANFVELNAKLGGTNAPDLRGRASFGRDDMGVGAANRLTAAAISGITGTTLGSSGGAETNTLTAAQLAQHSHGITQTAHSHGAGTFGADSAGAHQHDAFIRDPGHTHSISALGSSGANASGATPGGTFTVTTETGQPKTPNQAGTAGTGIRVNTLANGTGTDDKTASAGAHTHTVSGTSSTASATVSVDNSPVATTTAHNNMPPGYIVNKIVVAE